MTVISLLLACYGNPLKQCDKFLNRHACLLNDCTKEPALDVAGVVGHRYGAGSVWMLEVVVRSSGMVVIETGTFQRLHDLPCGKGRKALHS
jgi:hypothetical protein